MTLEDLKGLLEKATPGPWLTRSDIEIPYDAIFEANIIARRAYHQLREAGPELAALLVRAVEALAETVTAEPQTRLCYSKTCPGREFPCSVVDDARSLLRELGVEA